MMFTKISFTNNGNFQLLPTEMIERILSYTEDGDVCSINSVNRFFYCISKRKTIEKDRNLFVLYSIMRKYYDYMHHPQESYSQYIDGDSKNKLIREHLDFQLMISQYEFLAEANIYLKKHMTS